MKHCFNHGKPGIPIYLVNADNFDAIKLTLSVVGRNWCQQLQFDANAQHPCLIPDEKGGLECVLVVAAAEAMWSLSHLVTVLPPETYTLVGVTEEQCFYHYLAWGLACYYYDRYRENTRRYPSLCIPDFLDTDRLRAHLEAHYLIRNLINTPCAELYPEVFAEFARTIAESYSAEVDVITGKRLETEFPLVHAVGRASATPPCVVDMIWGEPGAFSVTLVGKGICFDSGGLNLKPASNMRLMKKDMGGAAHALGLAQLIMEMDLKVRLRVILPLAENAVAGNAFRPGDVLTARNGKTIEIGNTDAEGRLVLADALSYASEEKPALLIDFATLTGAARVAVGTEIAAMFSSQPEAGYQVTALAEQQQDPVCLLPLYQPYKKLLETPIADLSNDPTSGSGGAITAALFLQTFVQAKQWFHFDIMAWNVTASPGRPIGGEAMAIRAMFEYIRASCL